MPTALIVFIALTVAGLLIHLLCMRILAWRGVTVRAMNTMSAVGMRLQSCHGT